MRRHLTFVGNFVRNPLKVGAIWPSSKSLAKMMVRNFDLQNAKLVVEVGPGTGAFTGLILESLPDPTRYVGIEINEVFVQELQAHFPQGTFYNDSVEHLGKLLDERDGPSQADYVVSGLPWAQFGDELQRNLLQGILESMRPGGGFATFTYVHALSLPMAKKFRKLLESSFSSVELSPIVWRNLPPAVVYYCRLQGLE